MERKEPGVTSRPSEVGLNFIWPGLAQLAQGRTAAGVFFAIDACLGCALFLTTPEARVPAAVTLAVLTTWSLADAYFSERAAR